MEKHLILASASPRRRELLTQAGFRFEVIPSKKEEPVLGLSPQKTVEALSFQKAQDICEKLEEGFVVLGADTVVSLDGTILGKPHSEKEAYEMLLSLQGRSHTVYTGVTLLEKGKEPITFSCGTSVEVFPMSPEEINAYIQTGEPMDKAGAYGIQGAFCVYVKEIRGDYYNVVGLPVSRVYRALNKLGVDRA